MRRSSFGARRAAIVIAALAVVIAIVAVVAGADGTGSGTAGAASSFSACIAQRRFLSLTEHVSHGRLVDTIEDRSGGGVVGRFAVLPSQAAAQSFARVLGTASGSGAMNGRMVLLTTEATGRDARAIQTCGAPDFPVSP